WCAVGPSLVHGGPNVGLRDGSLSEATTTSNFLERGLSLCRKLVQGRHILQEFIVNGVGIPDDIQHVWVLANGIENESLAQSQASVDVVNSFVILVNGVELLEDLYWQLALRRTPCLFLEWEDGQGCHCVRRQHGYFLRKELPIPISDGGVVINLTEGEQ